MISNFLQSDFVFFSFKQCNDIPSKVSLHDEDDPQRLDPSYKVILLIIPFYFILRRIHEFGILYSFNKSSKKLEQKREELKRKYKELKKVFGYEKIATVNEKNAIKKNTECIKLLQDWFIINIGIHGPLVPSLVRFIARL